MKKTLLSSLVLLTIAGNAQAAFDTDAGTANLNFRLRYEAVDTDNTTPNANALTLRTVGNFKTKSFDGFYGFVEFENSFAIVDNYDYHPLKGKGPKDGQYNVVADPESHTEMDQAYVGYKTGGLSVKLGRQVITFDNHRFVGHVAWRNDKQTFDALRADYTFSEDAAVTVAYSQKRNRIVQDDADFDSSDIFVNGYYKTAYGKLTGYSYLLDDETRDQQHDTYGARFVGSQGKVGYTAELATQTSEVGGVEADTMYTLLEGSYNFGPLTAKLSYELLGSDDGSRGFATPLATAHIFNGWADKMLSTPNAGLQDVYLTLSGKLPGGKGSIAFHSYSTDESGAGDDLGSEINAIYNTKVGKFPVGVKAAFYSEGDTAAEGAEKHTDTTKVWAWMSYAF